MSDVFISYARSTAKEAAQITDALRSLGYGVWRDDALPVHRDYSEVIEERLRAAKAVVVVWSAEAVKSHWVRAEADIAREAGTVVQLTLDGAPLPMPFNRIQCADLSAWSGDLAEPGWLKVVASVTDLCGAPATPEKNPILSAADSPQVSISPRGNLPMTATSFLGRERQLAEIAACLERGRLVTLTGVGGVGKTRLAVETAHRLAANFPDGVWLIELAGLREPAATTQAVAGVFRIIQQPGASVEQSVVSWLGARRLLIVLDNCEHLINEAAALVAEILGHCPSVSILATSREALMIDGEHLWAVPSLAAGDAASPAVELFVDRARAVAPAFRLADHVEAVREICRRLDGIPLAIELAAARVRAMSPTQIRDRLAERFRLLTGGSRGALERHQSLRQAVMWSFDLLSEAELLTLARTSVFAGEFTLDDAEVVCAGDGVAADEVLDLIDSLVRKSLLTSIQAEPTVRYRLFETIRQFAEERLIELGEREATTLRHARRYADESSRRFESWRGPREPEAYAWLEGALDNLRAAFRRACDDGDVDIAATLASNVGDMARLRLREEAASWAEEILDRARSIGHRRLVVLLTWATSTAWARGELEAAVRLGEEAVSLAVDPRFEPFVWAYVDLAMVAVFQNDPERVLRWSRAGAAHAADRRDRFCLSFLGYFEALAGQTDQAMQSATEALVTIDTGDAMVTSLAWAHVSRGFAFSETEPAQAIAELQQGLDTARRAGNRYLESLCATSLATLAARQGDAAVALESLANAADVWLGVADVGVADQGLASLVVALGRAGDHLGAATIAGAMTNNVSPTSFIGLAEAIADALSALGDARRATAAAKGRAMTRGELLDYVRLRVAMSA